MTALGTPIYDDLTLENLETTLNDDPVCWRGDATAEWRVALRCCGFSFLQCQPHHDRWCAAVTRQSGRLVRCHTCGHVGVLGFGWYRVVQL